MFKGAAKSKGESSDSFDKLSAENLHRHSRIKEAGVGLVRPEPVKDMLFKKSDLGAASSGTVATNPSNVPTSPLNGNLTRDESKTWAKMEVDPVRRLFKVFNTSATFHSRTGPKHGNEDRYVVKLNVYGNEEGAEGRRTHLFGVFDGHGGDACAAFVEQNFAGTFAKNPSPEVTVASKGDASAIKKDMRKSLLRNLVMTVMKMEHEFCQWAIRNNDNSGACGLVMGVYVRERF